MSMLMQNLKQAEESRLARLHAQERAEQVAEVEQVARERLNANNARLEELKANELAEAEALALARIRAQTERNLITQAETLRDAERKLELTVIDRRNAELAAARAEKQREELDIAAREAAQRRIAEEQVAAQAAQERATAAAAATVAAEARRRTEAERQAATSLRRRAQWAAFWAGARFRPLAVIGTAMLILGAGAGFWGGAQMAQRSSRAAVTGAAGPIGGGLPEPVLHLDTDAGGFAGKVAARPPRDLPSQRRPHRQHR